MNIDNRIKELENKYIRKNISIAFAFIYPGKVELLFRDEMKVFKPSETEKIKEYIQINNIKHLLNIKILD